jgi:hypothetical protein
MSERRLLIVTPHFPPTDAVDMHRVRMNVRHYMQNGFRPVVLAVSPQDAGFLIDERMARSLPEELEVVRVAPLPLRLTRLVGITDVSLRAMAPLARVGDALITRFRPDLIFISTTRFKAMQLGVRWKKKFGTPFVLDFQDPWHTMPNGGASLARRGIKHRLARALHGRAERRTAPHAAGLIAVSESYIDALRGAYPSLRSAPAETIPFGFSRADFLVAEQTGTPWRPFIDHRPFALFAGRIAPNMTAGFVSLFKVMAMAQKAHLNPLSELAVGCVGTGYQRAGNPPVMLDEARFAGLADRFVEQPDRVPLLDSLASLIAADVLIVLGSEDLAYQPSKLFQLMSTGRPIICLAPSASRLASQVRGLDTVVFLPTDSAPDLATVRAANAKLHALLVAPPDAKIFAERAAMSAKFESETLAQKECALFERAITYHQNNP